MTRKKPLKILLIFKPELMPKYEDIITCYNERHNTNNINDSYEEKSKSRNVFLLQYPLHEQ